VITRLEGCGLVSTHPDHAQEPTATAQRHPQHVINRTRTGGVWLASVLFAALLGILMVVIPGTARIVQLRIAARRHRRAGAQADSQATPPPSAPARADVRPPAEPADVP
jgi:hypothetical protein